MFNKILDTLNGYRIIMKKDYNYNYDSDYSTITTIEEGKRRAFVNALCVTPSIKEAAVALGVAEKTIKDFCEIFVVEKILRKNM
jgi:hypothetical protein